MSRAIVPILSGFGNNASIRMLVQGFPSFGFVRLMDCNRTTSTFGGESLPCSVQPIPTNHIAAQRVTVQPDAVKLAAIKPAITKPGAVEAVAN